MNNTTGEQFYDGVLAAVRHTLLLSSGDTGTLPITMAEEAQAVVAAQSNETPPGYWEPVPPDEQVDSWDGFQFVDITRLGDVAFIAFRWRETGANTFVHTVDVREFLDRDMPVRMAAAIISVNLLERMGGGWHRQVSLRRIKGLTFIE